jgi:hypothetical protein
MSAIDQYKYACLGIVHCPTSHKVWGANPQIPLYRLDEDIPPDEEDFQGKQGDILLGGGSGESAAVRIAIPEAFYFWTHEDWCDYDSLDEIIKPYWTPTQAYVFGEGYGKLGWTPEKNLLEWWLAQHILNFLASNYPDDYQQYVGPAPLEEDGAICRLPTREELARLHPPPYVVRRVEHND